MDTSPILIGSSAGVSQGAPQSVESEEFQKQINEAVYKKNYELAIRNKTLSTIRSLYSITMSSVDLDELVKQITTTIVSSLEIEASFVFISHIEQDLLTLVAAATKNNNSNNIPELTLSTKKEQNNCTQCYLRREKIAVSIQNESMINTVYATYDTSSWKTLVYYPLLKQDITIGILVLCFGKSEEDISHTEHETVQELLQLVTLSIDRAQLYESLEEANKKLTELDKLKDEFVSLASHELRTPMAAIKGSISTILEGYAGPISNDSKEFLTAAYNENDRLIRLVNNLLNTSRIESGKMSYTITHVNIVNLVTDVVKNLQIGAKEKGLYLRYEIQGTVPLVIADEDKIKEVVINLIGNALKFTSAGGITIKTEVKDEMVVTSVADTGTGIHKEDFDLLFKKFSQVKTDQQYTKSYGGTGLGLYLSQKIIEGLGGNIWLDSEVGKGTTFYFTLPIVK